MKETLDGIFDAQATGCAAARYECTNERLDTGARAYERKHNLVPMTMCEAARRHGVPIERISFVDALRW